VAAPQQKKKKKKLYEFQNCAVRQTDRQEAVGSAQKLLVFGSGHRGNSCIGRAMTEQFVRDTDNRVH